MFPEWQEVLSRIRQERGCFAWATGMLNQCLSRSVAVLPGLFDEADLLLARNEGSSRASEAAKPARSRLAILPGPNPSRARRKSLHPQPRPKTAALVKTRRASRTEWEEARTIDDEHSSTANTRGTVGG
ncbi:hypothetical protein SCAR479_03660 [Seiridium cardinale]|uniref:Uncharacterized protein n=1 Tax=Seiridium cardinale TaxID=138064 RepID=A0ABR2Y0M6_9PEZI